MTREQEQLLALVRLAIHPDEVMPAVLNDTAIDWEKVLDEAQKQTLVGVAYAGVKIWTKSDVAAQIDLMDIDVPLTHWHLLSETIKRDNLRVNHRTAQVCRVFAQEGFRTSVMKGQGNALLYGPELSLLRMSGDIDVWVEGGFKRVYDYVMQIAPTKKVSAKHIEFKVFDDVTIEVHFRPLIMSNPFRDYKLEKILAAQSEACYNHHVQLLTKGKDGKLSYNDATVTTILFNVVHQLAHIHRHLFSVGIGLRHLMDYYYQLENAERTLSQEEKVEVIGYAKSLGFERLAQAMSWILTTQFGLPEQCNLWEPNEKDGRFLLEDIFRTGNFGHADKRLSKGIFRGGFKTFIEVTKHNLLLSRFDRTDWFWGPISRIQSFFWRKRNGYEA